MLPYRKLDTIIKFIFNTPIYFSYVIMRIAISNLAWDPKDDHELLPLLKQNGVDGAELALSKYIPPADLLSATDQTNALILINNFLSSKDKAVLFKIALFLNIIDLVSFCFGLCCFRKLSPEKKIRVMNFFFDSPLPLLRKGFWGINTLAKMAVYGQPAIYQEIGYNIKSIGT